MAKRPSPSACKRGSTRAFIEELYFKRFGKKRPDVALSIGERAPIQQAKKATRKEAKQQRLEGHPSKEGNRDAPAGHELDH